MLHDGIPHNVGILLSNICSCTVCSTGKALHVHEDQPLFACEIEAQTTAGRQCFSCQHASAGTCMRGAARYLREAYSLYEVVSEPRIGVYTFQLSCTLLVLPNMPHILTIQNQLHPQICAQAHCRSAKALLRTSASCFLPRQACWGSRLRGVRQSTAYAQQSPGPLLCCAWEQHLTV